MTNTRDHTPEERERMVEFMWERLNPGRQWFFHKCDVRRKDMNGLLTAFPQLWDSLPPDPVAEAKARAEREAWRLVKVHPKGWTGEDAEQLYVNAILATLFPEAPDAQ